MRTTIVSTSRLTVYKTILILILSAVSLFVIIMSVYAIGDLKSRFYWFFNFVVYGILVYKSFNHLKKIKSISFDESSIYYVRKGYEVQVPFEDIKSIEIKSLDGVYEINFFYPTQDGVKLFFKTSLWYPINFKKQDELVNVLRDKIDRYKRTLPAQNYDELPSYSIQ